MGAFGVSNLINPPDDAAAISLNAATSGTGKVFACNICRQMNWFTRYTGTPSAGVYRIEWCVTPDAADAQWRQLAEYNAADLVTDPAAGQGTWPGPMGYIRVRVTDPVVDGTITVYINGLRN